MWAIFKRDMLKNWLMILGWGIGFGLLAYFLFDIYEAMFLQNVDLVNLLEAFPEGMMAFFGGEDIDIFEPAGFVHLEFFSYIHIILGIMIINSATSLLVKKEEEGTLELTISQPISRTELFWSRLFALLLSLVLIFVLIWAGFALGLKMLTRLIWSVLSLCCR
jgi:ABC-2 type transport system permease protein